MIQIRKSKERGYFDHGWLNTYHTFSFGDYYDPNFMGFRDLRVINEDWVKEGRGFPTHPHQDMEIITYILEGELAHKDSMGTVSTIRPGEVQRMSAGTGVTHSEYNHSSEEPVHLLQIWILPNQKGLKPGYEQKEYSEEQKLNQFFLVASNDGRKNSVTIHQDVQLYVSILESGKKIDYEFHPKRYGWIQVVRGSVNLNGQELAMGDGAAISDEKMISLVASEKSEILLFDLN